jgi:uncharacterized protein YueI
MFCPQIDVNRTWSGQQKYWFVTYPERELATLTRAKTLEQSMILKIENR